MKRGLVLSLVITAVLLLGVLLAADVASATQRSSKLARRRHAMHRKTKLHNAQVEGVGEIYELIKDLLEAAEHTQDIIYKIKHYKDQVGCRTPPLVSGTYSKDALTQVYTSLAREIYDKCNMVQRINFLRSWGATAFNMIGKGMTIDDLPTISMSDCDPLLLTIMAMKATCTTDNCDSMWKSWLYYTSGPCKDSTNYKPSCMGNVFNQWTSYCQLSTGANPEDASCEFDTLCPAFFSADGWLESLGACISWKFNKEDSW